MALNFGELENLINQIQCETLELSTVFQKQIDGINEIDKDVFNSIDKLNELELKRQILGNAIVNNEMQADSICRWLIMLENSIECLESLQISYDGAKRDNPRVFLDLLFGIGSCINELNEIKDEIEVEVDETFKEQQEMFPIIKLLSMYIKILDELEENTKQVMDLSGRIDDDLGKFSYAPMKVE